ncbi:lipopolysaccharide biosynthesis protein [Geminocystis herdmanii]|uniref:lipopolysaccharide biosynthesis protein n=1 Tax=Geminocystis herdmanii TaxID=669359 RepID=UPI000346B9D8|nr:lipopolysaccharide biosynthesis protein [Geminocystis herdmanii]
MSIRKKIVEGLFWSSIQNWGSQAGSFIIFITLARLLTPSALGLVALANLFIKFFQLVLAFGFIQKLIQKEDINDLEINTVFWTQICVGFFLTFSIFVTADYIANGFQQPLLTPILQTLSFLFIIRAFSETQRGLLVRAFRFKAIAIRSLFSIIMSGIVGILMAVNNYGVWSLVGQQLTYEITGVLVLWKASDWRPKLQFSVTDLRSFFSFGINILGYQLTQFFNQRTDSLLVGYFLGEVSLGYYTIAHRILEVMSQLLIGTLNQIALPLFSRLQNDDLRFFDVYYTATQWTCLITFPMFLSVIIVSPELIVTVFGEKWLNVVPILEIISLAGIIRGITFFQRSAFVALGKPNLQFKLALINSILNLIFCLIAIPWGISTIALAYVLSDYVAFPLGQWMLSKLISLSWKHYLSNFLAPISCTFGMILVMILSKNLLTINLEPYLRLIIISLIGGVTYIFSLIILFPVIFQQIWSLIKLN